MAATVGQPAPDFSVPGTGGATYTLSEQRGHPVVLAFYPGDNTQVCTMQLRSYSSDMSAFESSGATLWGISPQGVQSHEDFACKQSLAMPLLADTDKAVAKAYGILGPLGFYRRSLFVIDAEGVIRYAHRGLTGLTFVKSDDIVKAIEAARV